MLGAILSAAVKPLSDIGSQWLDHRKQIADAKADLELAIINNKARLAESTESHNSEKEMKTLEIATPWVRWVIVFHVLALFDVGILWPERAVEVYENLAKMPEWVVGLFVTIFGFYFVVSKLSDKGADMVAAWRGTRDVKEDNRQDS